MRNANPQRASSMILVRALPIKRARRMSDMRRPRHEVVFQDGQRCALLTTKSRKTCTRATVFNSSG